MARATSNKHIKSFNFTKEVMDALREFGNITNDQVLEALDQALEEGTEMLKNERSAYKIHSGKYNQGWTFDSGVKGYKTKGAIYNATHYRRVHLLENGHAVIGDNVSVNPARARVHVLPVDTYTKERFQELLKEKIEKNG